MSEQESGQDKPSAAALWFRERVARAEAHLGAGEMTAALGELDQVVAAARDLEERARLCLAVAGVLERHRAHEEACGYFVRGIACEPRDPETSYFLHNTLAFNLNCIGQHERAEKYARMATALDPLRHNAWKNLGIALEGQAMWGEAAWAYHVSIRAYAGDGRALALMEALVAAHHDEVAARLDGLDAMMEALRAHAARWKAAQARGRADG